MTYNIYICHTRHVSLKHSANILHFFLPHDDYGDGENDNDRDSDND